MKKFIFDVDGTLTYSRRRIDNDFLSFFMEFSSKHEVYLVTGSDRQKTIEQITPELYNNCERVYNCSGSDVYEGSTNVYRDEWELPDDVELFLCDELDYSQFPIRNGLHIERRPGGVNFSILGRGEGEGRDQYVKWDKRKNERMDIAYRLKERFPDLEVQVGGQTGLDLAPLGRNKSQILRDFKWFNELYFFGDMMEVGQNDYPLAKEVGKRGGFTYKVDGYNDTMKILKEIVS